MSAPPARSASAPPHPQADAPGEGPRELLSVRQATAIIVGVVIGAGIFKAPALVAGLTGDLQWMFGAWLLGGVMSLIGALCYAELSTTYPNAGGDYHFLQRAFGRRVSLLFGWARLSVITTGSIALLAFVFGDYMQTLLPLPAVAPAAASALYGALAVLLLSRLNMRGVQHGGSAQVWLTAAEIIGLLLIVLAAFFVEPPAAAAATAETASEGGRPTLAGFGLAMVFVLLTYGGWNEAAYISAEVRDKQHNMTRALVVSIVLITLLYLVVNWAYWRGLGLQGMAGSQAIAADLLGVAFGPVGEKVISAVIAIAALTSINATIIVGARTTYALGRDWRVLGRLGEWDRARGTPANALRVQCAAALLLVAIGAAAGGGFKAMVEFTAPVFWIFFLLTGLALFVLRRREPQVPRPFRVPLYPLLPLLFCAMCVYMLWSSLSYVHSQSMGGWNAAWISVAVLGAGAVLLLVMKPAERQAMPGSADAPASTPAPSSRPAPARRPS